MEDFNNFLCKKCGMRSIDTTESSHSILCTNCREEQINYPIPKLLIIIISIVLIISIGLTFIILPKSIKEYKTNKIVYEEIEAGKINSLLNSDIDISADKAVGIFELAMNRGQYDYAVYLHNTYIVENEISESNYNKMNYYIDKLEKYSNSWSNYYDIVDNIDGDIYDEQINSNIRQKLMVLLNDSSCDKATIYYLMGITTIDFNTAIEDFNNSIASDAKFSDSKVELANIYRRNKDLDKAREILNEVLSYDSFNSSALRSLSVISMLENDMKEAVKFAREAYESYSEDYYVYETLIIALNESGKIEESEKYLNEYLDLGYELDEDTMQLLNDEITLEEYYYF